MRILIVWIYLGIYTGFVLTIVFLATSLLINMTGRKDELDKTFEPAPDVDELNDAVARAAGGAGGGVE
jgi:TRAP-type C4-dicarboxylate transport system permease small subunit